MRNTRRNKVWMRNRDQLKNPKIFNITMLRNPDGSFHMIGGESKVLARINQHSAQWVKVDTRDLATELRQNRIIAR